MSENLVLIRTPGELKALQETLKDAEFLAFDTETTGLSRDSTVIGLSVAADVDTGYYAILHAWDPATQTLVDKGMHEAAKEFVQFIATKKLVMHNGLFDVELTLSNFGIDLIDALHTDTMILAHLLDENRHVGLKELGVSIFGDDAATEAKLMKESIVANGGKITKAEYELFKADSDLIGRYGAKDAILTLKLFYEMVPQLYEQNLDKFFYDEESMPLLKGPTRDLNYTGLRVDAKKLEDLRRQLEADLLEAEAFITKEVQGHVAEKYPGDKKTNRFNFGSNAQLAWLLYFQLGNDFQSLTDAGRELCKALGLKPTYTRSARRDFIQACHDNLGRVYEAKTFNPKTGKMSAEKKVREPWNYVQCGKAALSVLAPKYKWVAKLLEYKKNDKLLTTYVTAIQEKQRYGVIRPSFKQHGTTSGRYSSSNPNFQNLPRDDKRIKSCIVARDGHVFVGADYSQLEPRVFASVSQDPELMACFEKGQDFYSVVGAPIFGKTDCSLYKDDPDSFANKYPKLRHIAKAFALATPYGTGAFQQSMALGLPIAECDDIISNYLTVYSSVHEMMLTAHQRVKEEGVVYSMFGRPRRLPEAKLIAKRYGKNTPHAELPREARTLCNLSVNHAIQSAASSIVNRAMIAMHREFKERGWNDVKIVLTVHDEVIVEGPKHLANDMAEILQRCMESTNRLPGVALKADPEIAYNLADLK